MTSSEESNHSLARAIHNSLTTLDATMWGSTTDYTPINLTSSEDTMINMKQDTTEESNHSLARAIYNSLTTSDATIWGPTTDSTPINFTSSEATMINMKQDTNKESNDDEIKLLIKYYVEGVLMLPVSIFGLFGT